MLDPLDVDVSVGDQLSLAVELGVELSILSLTVVVNGALFIYLRAERLDETNVGVNP